MFHGTSTDVSTLITTSTFRKANVAFFGPGIYMTDMLDYAGFYSYETKIKSKFINHHRIRNVDESSHSSKIRHLWIFKTKTNKYRQQHSIQHFIGKRQNKNSLGRKLTTISLKKNDYMKK